MLYKLGDIQFRGLITPSSISRQESVNFVQMERLFDKPTLQKVGGVLTTFDWTIELHYEFVNIREALATWRAAMIKGESMTLIDGLGNVEGQFVIESLNTDILRTDAQGRYLVVNCDIRLLEYVSADQESDTALAARKAGFANVSVDPIIINPAPKFQSGPASIMRDIVTSKSAAASASLDLKKAASVPELAKKYMDTAKRGLDTAKASTQKARAAADSVASKISNVAALKSSLDSVISNIDAITSNYDVSNISAIRNLTLVLDNNLGILTSVASQLSNVAVLRK